jgi:hypothetical protein
LAADAPGCQISLQSEFAVEFRAADAFNHQNQAVEFELGFFRLL